MRRLSNKKTYTICGGIFFLLFLTALPFHYYSVNQIVERQTSEENIRSFFIDGRSLEELKFQPREYIQIDRRPVKE